MYRCLAVLVPARRCIDPSSLQSSIAVMDEADCSKPACLWHAQANLHSFETRRYVVALGAFKALEDFLASSANAAKKCSLMHQQAMQASSNAI